MTSEQILLGKDSLQNSAWLKTARQRGARQNSKAHR